MLRPQKTVILKMKFINIYFICCILIIIIQPSEIRAQSTIISIPLPSREFKRVKTEPGTFGEWLRSLPLKNQGFPVFDYRGRVFKSENDSSVAAVVDWNVSGQRLQQCMDILVRFYAEYLWQKKLANNLNLPLPGGYWLSWQKWQSGNRPEFKGIAMNLSKSAKPDTTHKAFDNYLQMIFNASHTQQFYHAFKPIDRSDVRIGDFIVRKGTKGHAVMIVDLATDERGSYIGLVGNGDTPACQFFLLNFKQDQPWIPFDFDEESLNLPLRRKISWDGLRRFDDPKFNQ